jgi:hypothetical protein
MLEKNKNFEQVKINDRKFEISLLQENEKSDNITALFGNVCFSYKGYVYSYSGIIKQGMTNALFRRKISKSGEKHGVWERMKQTGEYIPFPFMKGAATGVVVDDYFYLFGGLRNPTNFGRIRDPTHFELMCKMNISTCKWTELKLIDSNGKKFSLKEMDSNLMFYDPFKKQIFIYRSNSYQDHANELVKFSLNSINNEIICETMKFKQIGNIPKFFVRNGACLLFPFNSDKQLAFIYCGIYKNTGPSHAILCFDIKKKNFCVIDSFPTEIQIFSNDYPSCLQISKNESLIFGGMSSNQKEIFHFELIEIGEKKIIKCKNIGNVSNIIPKGRAGFFSNVEESFCFMFGGISVNNLDVNNLDYLSNDLILIEKKKDKDVVLFKKRLIDNRRFCDCRISFKYDEDNDVEN